jgi:acetylornithine deacetylase/succinyl-diaminopimelate desuccinylase-like protein
MRGIHGIDEHVTIDSLAKMVLFYTQLIKTWTTASSASA